MGLSKLSYSTRDEITLGRLWAAAWRRFTAIPHRMAWRTEAVLNPGSLESISSYKKVHSGERCFILGNGPSIATMDLGSLQSEISFGLNRIYMHFDNMDFKPTYFVCMNELVIEQSSEAIEELTLPRFINWNRRKLFASDKSILFLLESYKPHFSDDLLKGVWGGATVTYVALQIAYYMGVQQVILIGVDHNFVAKGAPHKIVVSQGEDQNHFDKEYFPKGFRWQLPDLTISEYAYRLAKEAFEADGREILDATVGGKLEVFTKVDFDTLF